MSSWRGWNWDDGNFGGSGLEPQVAIETAELLLVVVQRVDRSHQTVDRALGYDRDEGKNCTYPPQTVVLQQKILAPAAPG
jgi:hypothetical protein